MKGAVTEQIVPADWLTVAPPSLPQGWTLSVDLDGNLSYLYARYGTNSVVLVGPDGESTEFTAKDGGWVPPAGVDDVMSQIATPSGVKTSVHGADGLIYEFDRDGKLLSATSALDDRKPAAPVYKWFSTSPRLQEVTDPVSTRKVSYVYAGTGTCPAPPSGQGYDAAPPSGMLCQVQYWDGTKTNLFYKGKQLARIENPGNPSMKTDFGYEADGFGRTWLNAIRDARANEWVAADTSRDTSYTRTLVTYDFARRVSTVSLPTPDGTSATAASRPRHTYTYVEGSDGQVAIDGITPVAAALGNTTFQYGTVGDRALAGDWNGDGRPTAGVVSGYEGVTWFLRNSLNSGSPNITFDYGNPGDVPFTGDWNNDRTDTPGVRRGFRWYLRNSNSAGVADVSFDFGDTGDVPVVGDWNGDGIDTPGVFRNGVWYLRNSNSSGVADISFGYGDADDVPVVGDWNGDGIDSVGVVRARSNTFYLRNSLSTGIAEVTVAFGTAGDTPLAGDWNLDGKDTPGVFHLNSFSMRDATTTARRATYDDWGRVTSDSDATAKTTYATWDANDRLTSTRDAAGVMSTTVYDDRGWPVDAYGPAQASCFSGLVPAEGNGTCGSTGVPKTHTDYDGGIRGLAAAYFTNPDLDGTPKLHAMGVGNVSGAVDRDWVAGGPEGPTDANGSAVVDNWSVRLTGDVVLPVASTYSFTALADDGVRVWVDDILVIDSWNWTGSLSRPGVRTITTQATNTRHRLRAEFREIGGNALFRLQWAWTGKATETIPGTALSPRLGLATLTTDPDGRKVATEYARPELGLPTATVVDPGGLNLRTTTSYEAAGAGFLRRTARSLSAAGAAYAPTVLADNPTGYWRLGETSGTTAVDSSGRGLNGTYEGGPARGAGGALVGEADPAVTFDGTDDAVSLGLPEALKTPRFSVESWFKTTAGSGDRVIYRWRYDGVELKLINGRVFGGFSAGNGLGSYAQSPNSYADGAWHHTVVTYDGLAVRLYVDGAQVATTPSTLTPLYGWDRASIGRDGTATWYWNGTLDDVAVYGHALVATRVQAHYDAGTRGPTSTYSYFGNTQTADDPCQAGTQTINQGGALRTSVDADPDGKGPKVPIVREYRYDAAGRQVASRVTSDANWTCMTYDAAGRPASHTDAAGKQTTFSYADPLKVVTTYVDSGGTTRTTSEQVDLLGRVVAYTDEHGTITRRTYDQPGRLTGTTRQFSGGTATQLTTMTYDVAGRVLTSKEYASGTARTTTYGYDSGGRPTAATLPNGVVTTTDYDSKYGTLAALTHARSGTTLSAWSYARALSGNVASETGAGRTRSFTYDGAGRLTRTVEGATTRNYAYDANTNRCGLATACDGQWAYDAADRITASPYGYDYVYDSHGNLTSSMLTGSGTTQNLNQSLAYDTAASATSTSYPITVGKAGPVTAGVDWTPSTALTRTASGSGTLAAGGTASSTMAVEGKSEVSSTLTWSKGSHAVSSGPMSVPVPAAGVATRQISPDATGTISGEVTWGGVSKGYSASGTAPAATATPPHWQQPITASANGTISATVTWSLGADLDLYLVAADGTTVLTSNTTLADPNNTASISYSVSGLDSYPSSRTYYLRVKSKALQANFNLTASYPVSPTVDMKLKNSSGTVVASSSLVTGQRKRTLSYSAAAPGSYTFEISSADEAVTTTFSETHWMQAFADLTYALKNPGGSVIASTRSSSGSITIPSNLTAGGSYSWAITNNSTDLSAPWSRSWSATTRGDDVGTGTVAAAGSATRSVIADGAGSLFSSLSWTAGTGGFADLTLTLKSGTTTLTSVRSASGSATLSYPLTAGGTYSLVITNNSTLTNVPSYTLNTTLPRRGAFTLALKNSGGTTIATGTGQKPVSLSASVAAGNYTIVVTPVSGKGTATVTASYPGADKQVTYTYDGNDHATEINDGSTITTETLSPSGRVIRRVVKNASTQAVTEDVIFGYQDGSDSPSYSRPTAGGTVTSYLGGAGGLSVIDVGGTPTYQHANGHGDIIGTSNSAGTFTAITPTDEFGVGTVPASRLGWLGAHERFTTNTALGVMRMGVRLYDPRLGRFLEVDPVEGGSANDYDYVAGDPINSFDIDGRCRAMSRPTVADYLTGRACAPAGFRERFGYVPVFRRTRAGVRAMRANGECSWFPDTGPWWDFQNACKTHDYGYDLIRFGAIRNRKAVDDFFRNDMKADCKRRSLFKRGCRSTADNVYAAVRTFGGSVI